MNPTLPQNQGQTATAQAREQHPPATDPNAVQSAYDNLAILPRHIYEKGRLRIDFDAYDVFVEDTLVSLSPREFDLLRFFVSAPHRAYSRQQILSLVWGNETDAKPRTVDVLIRRLRQRIERDDAHPQLIVTVSGIGYKFNEHHLVVSEGGRR